jgi:hypothetical protein
LSECDRPARARYNTLMSPPPSQRHLALGTALVLTAWLGLRPARAAEPASAPPLDGKDVHFDYDGKDVGKPLRAWLGRAFVHRLVAATPDEPRAVVVFLHGTNAQLIKYRWMGGGPEGDVRRIVAGLIEAGQIPPTIVAGPSSIDPSAIVNARTSWPGFDLERFVARLATELQGTATVDRSRVVVVAHSGGGCNPKGGLATAVSGSLVPLGAMSIDTCMDPEVATVLAGAPPETAVVVSWQTQGWTTRPFDDFLRVFRREVTKLAAPGALRELDHQRVREPMPHDAMVPLTLRKWLPKLLPACPESP